jgi:hypothetical protein
MVACIVNTALIIVWIMEIILCLNFNSLDVISDLHNSFAYGGGILLLLTDFHMVCFAAQCMY